MTSANQTYPMRWTFDEDMDEISGFGDGYEASCRRMLAAGGDWADAHPEEWVKVKRLADLPRECERLMILACEGEDPNAGPTGAMMGVVANLIGFVQRNGWEEFVRQFRARRGANEV